MVAYWCGYSFKVFAGILIGKVVQWRTCNSNEHDILVYGAHGPCACDPRTFAGRILSANGEDHQPALYTNRTLQIGAGGYPFSYGALEWLNRNFTQYTGPVKHYAVAYANSNCVKEREMMVEALSAYVPVHAYGRCTGSTTINMHKEAKWSTNAQWFQGYAFVFAAEHGVTPGYTTEKAFVAAAAGAVPIYWGASSLATYMNPHRILFWNASTPRLVKELMHSNLRDLPAVDRVDLVARARHILSKLMSL